jgi:hypothetical protein
MALFPSDSNIAHSDLLLLSPVLRTLQFRSLARLLLLSVRVLSSKDGLHYFYLRDRQADYFMLQDSTQASENSERLRGCKY